MTKDSKKIKEDWDYEGEIDENGKACGTGKASSITTRYEGSFLNDKMEGIGTYSTHHPMQESKLVGEFRDGKMHGKITDHCFMQIVNLIFSNNRTQQEKSVTETPDAAFYKDARPHKALSSNWKDYI